MDVPFFDETGFQNANADALTFRDEGGNPVQYQTAKLPDANILWSPRVGFNWDVTGNRTTQVRGGTGVFTGPPAYVWISNQIGNTGVLTGFERVDNTKARPVEPEPRRLQAHRRHRGPGLELRARADRPGLQVPPDLADATSRWTRSCPGASSARPSSSTTGTSTGSTTSTPTSRRHRRPSCGADNRPPLHRANRINCQRRQRHRPEEPGRGPVLDTPPPRSRSVPPGHAQDGLHLLRRQEHRRPRLDRLRLLEQQPAPGRSEQPRPRLVGPGPPLLPRRLLPRRVPEVRGDDLLGVLRRATRRAPRATSSRATSTATAARPTTSIYVPRDAVRDELRAHHGERPVHGRGAGRGLGRPTSTRTST